MEKYKFRRMRLFQKLPIVRASIKHILIDPAWSFFFGSVLHQFQIIILSIVCNLVETMLE